MGNLQRKTKEDLKYPDANEARRIALEKMEEITSKIVPIQNKNREVKNFVTLRQTLDHVAVDIKYGDARALNEIIKKIDSVMELVKELEECAKEIEKKINS